MRGAETVIVPVALVVETGDGARRMVQPAVDRGDPAAASAFESRRRARPRPAPPAVAEHVHDLQAALGELLVAGAARADRGLRDAWAALAERGEALGSVLLTADVDAGRHGALAARAHDPAWTPETRSPPPLPSPPTLELARTLSRGDRCFVTCAAWGSRPFTRRRDRRRRGGAEDALRARGAARA